MNVLDINNISYSIKEKPILREISFSVKIGSTLGISGESGSGKTTLAKIIAGLIIPSSGSINFHINNHKKISPVQILFQNNGEIINPYRRPWNMVREVIALKNADAAKDRIENETKEILRSLDLDERLWHRRGYELSGGEQQRTALARILSSSPEIIVFDEPFSAQDPESEFRLINIFKRLNSEERITLITISHDIKLLKEFCSDYLILTNGKVEDSGYMNDIEASLNRYTKFLLEAEKYKLKPDDFIK